MAKNILSIAIVVIFAIIAGFSLLNKGLIPTHDGEYHVVRFYLFDEAIRDGNMYPRWASHLNNGFGVPLFTFVYPLPNYIASLFHLFGLSFINSFKIEMFFATILGGIFFYLWSKEFWGKIGGIVSSIFYTFSPYHFVDVYIRGSVGEIWALAFFPAFLWSYTKFINEKQSKFLIYSSIFLSLIIFSHNILALMFFSFSLVYMLFIAFIEKNKSYLIKYSSLILILGLGLSAVFWIPALVQTKYVTGLQIFDITSHFPDLYQLLIPSWGSGFSGSEISNQMSFQIGLANLLVIFISFITLFVMRKNKKKRSTILFFIFCFFIVMFLMLKSSNFIWQIIPFMNYFQFPWRFLSMEILFASFLSGGIVCMFSKKLIKIIVALFLIFLTFSLGVGYARSAYYMDRNDNYYVSRPNFINGTNSPGNYFNTIFLKTIPDAKKPKIEFLKGEGKIIDLIESSNKYVFQTKNDKNSEILINVSYFPGWNAYVNGKRVPVSLTENGLFSISLVSTNNKVEVVFENANIVKFSTLITLLSIILIVLLFMRPGFVTIKR